MSEPTRTLTITPKRVPWVATPWVGPRVVIDGTLYPLGWTRRTYAIPADRQVAIECYMPWLSGYGRRIAYIEPTDAAELEYSPPSSRFYPGELGAPGTTRTQGTGFTYVMFAVSAAIVALSIWQIVT